MLTEMVTSNILPASFEITVTDPKTLEKIYQNYATNTDIVDEIIPILVSSSFPLSDFFLISGIV